MMISFVSMVFVLPAAAQHHHCSVLFSQIFFDDVKIQDLLWREQRASGVGRKIFCPWLRSKVQ
jgi:hypothetical protein